MTFDDWVKDTLKIEAREITHLTQEEQKKVYFTVSADDLIKLWNAGVENGVSGMQLKITELETQIEKMKCCQNCDNWNWKHNKCEKKLKGDCFKHSKWVMRNF